MASYHDIAEDYIKGVNLRKFVPGKNYFLIDWC